MRICQHCGAGVPNYAGFCGECGQLVSIGEPATREQTVWGSHSVSPDKAQTTLITNNDRDTGYALADEDTGKNPALKNVDEDEEERRRSILADFNLPLLADAISGQATANVPMVQGTPQIMGAPTVTGTPSFGGWVPSAGEGGAANPLVLPAPGQQAFTSSFAHGGSHFNGPPTGLPHGPHTPPIHGPNKPPIHGPNKPQPQNSGCMVWLLVIILVPLIILASIISIGLTILAPTLSLDGTASVAVGDTLHLHGGHFIPGNSVTCILDGSIPLTSSTTLPAHGAAQIADALVLVQQANTTTQAVQTQGTSAQTTIKVGSDGTFSITFVVGQDWTVGTHTIRATEALSPRSATTTFTVTGTTQPTRTASVGTTPTVTTTPTTTPTLTPTMQTKSGLIAITPNIIKFGPISTGYTQSTNTQILLNTTGTSLLNWTATWNSAQASWLHLTIQSGQVQEPNAQAIIMSAVVGNLQAGTYNATILFSSDGQNGQNLSLPVSLTVQAGCVKATPTTLNFTTTIGTSNPASQTLKLNNCGAIGNWAATTTGGPWLLISPAGGNLNKGASQSIIVSAVLANVRSGAGTYQGQILFQDGPTQAVVNITFTVLPPPTLGINITSFSIQRQCAFVRILWQCKLITLNNSQTATTDINWTAAGTGRIAITVTPAAGTLQPGQTAPVEVVVPRVGCDIGTPLGTVTFNGPANTISVAVTC
jgi:hypothetical protein